MRRFATISLIILALCVLNLPAATPDAKSLKEVQAAMEGWRQAMVKYDAAALEKLYHEDLTFDHSNGMQENKANAIKNLLNGKSKLNAIDLADMTYRMYGNVMLVKGKVTFHATRADGTKHDIDLNSLHVWLKGPSGWQMVARTAIDLNPPATAPKK
jgi:ketosteroid isomerase-like protein